MTILQWTPPQPPSGLGEGKCPYDHCTAETPFGKFLITWKSWNPCDLPTVDETPWGDWFGAFDDVEAAQQACEDEYRERLQAALAQPSPEGELTDEELDAIAADRARRPAPEPPAEGEVAELVAALRQAAQNLTPHPSIVPLEAVRFKGVDTIRRALEALPDE